MQRQGLCSHCGPIASIRKFRSSCGGGGGGGGQPRSAQHPVDPEMPEPSFWSRRREVSGKAAPPPGSPWPAAKKNQSGSGTQSVLRPVVLLTSVAMALGTAQLALPAILTLLGVLLPGESGMRAAVWPAPRNWGCTLGAVAGLGGWGGVGRGGTSSRLTEDKVIRT